MTMMTAATRAIAQLEYVTLKEARHVERLLRAKKNSKLAIFQSKRIRSPLCGMLSSGKSMLGSVETMTQSAKANVPWNCCRNRKTRWMAL